MKQIGFYRVRGIKGPYRQKNWKILAEGTTEGINLMVEEYKRRGDLFLLSEDIIGFWGHIYSRGQYAVYTNLTPECFLLTLDCIGGMLKEKYKSLRWSIDKDRVDDILLLVKL